MGRKRLLQHCPGRRICRR